MSTESVNRLIIKNLNKSLHEVVLIQILRAKDNFLKMKIEVTRLDDAYNFLATNDKGNTVEMDSSLEHGGADKGFRPMQMLLAGLGGCSGIDVVDILKKQKQSLKDLKISIEGEREANAVPSLFKKINIHFTFYGDVEETKAKRAVELSMDKYCSVAKTLDKSAEISYSFSVVTG